MNPTLQTSFSNGQLELLKLFRLNLDETEMSELRELLLDFKFRKLQIEVERSADEKSYTAKNFDQMATEHNRTPYSSYRKKLASQK